MEGRYQAYPEYKDSGVESSLEIPLHWSVGKVKFVVDNLDKLRIPLSAEERSTRQGDYPYYGASGIIDYVDNYLFDEETILFGEDGANLFARSTPLAFLASGKYWVNNHAHILKPKDGINSYWVNCLENIDVSPVVSGSAQPKLTAEALGCLDLVYPPTVLERKQIANFLDHETAKIDTLIEKQQKLIKLLKEKRQAVISHAVTKGLNPAAPMKDSGVEWIGDIPVHWDVAEVRRFTQEHRQGYYSDKGYDESGHKVVRITDLLADNVIDVSDSPYYLLDEENRKRYQLEKGDFVFQRTGSHKKIGIYTSDELAVYASFLIRFRFNNKLNHSYLLNYFNSKPYTDQLNEQIHGGVNPNIHAENIKVCKVTMPPLDEQAAIYDFLQSQSKNYHELIAKVKSAIELMQERRTALISAAVTGKIDVRNWQPPNPKTNQTNKAIQ